MAVKIIFYYGKTVILESHICYSNKSRKKKHWEEKMSGEISGNEDNSNTYHLKLQGKD